MFRLVLFFVLFVYAQAKDEVYFQKSDFPPFTILDGVYKNQGISDQALWILKKLLNEYQFHEEYNSFERTYDMMKKYDLICSASFLKNQEREKFMYFSQPFDHTLSNALVIKHESVYKLQGFINSNNEVDLEALLKKGEFKLGLTKGRIYGEVIDSILKKSQNRDMLYIRSAHDMAEGLIKMLLTNRDIDASIVYPIEKSYILKKLQLNGQRLILYKIKGVPKYFHGRYACSKMPQSKKLIERINKHISIIKSHIQLKKEEWKQDHRFYTLKQEFQPSAQRKDDK